MLSTDSMNICEQAILAQGTRSPIGRGNFQLMEVGPLQDGAAPGPEDSGAVLGVLRSVGLVGPKLALQIGEEEDLAKQVAERAGLAYGGWIKDLISSHVKEACASIELDARLEGAAMTPGAQAVKDAVAHMEMEQKETAAGQSEVPAVTIVLPRRGQMEKWRKGGMIPQVSLEEEEGRVLKALYEELKVMDAPVLAQIGQVARPERVKQALLGKYRASSVKRYLAYWQGFRRWCNTTSGSNPLQPAQLVDYLLAREEEGMGASIPLAVSKAVSWFEKTAGIPEDEGYSNDALVATVVRDLMKKLEEGAPPRKRAPRMLSCFIPALERLVADQSREDRLRLGAWVKLVKIWASLRFDDLAHIRVDMARVYEGRMAGLLKRTKTTGAGKRVKELPFHVATCAWIEQSDWLTMGMEILGKSPTGSGDLLVPSGAGELGATGNKVMQYQEAVAWSTEVMSALEDGRGGRLVPDGWERFWTEHSERATLASGLAALGVPKPERDMLGRWAPEGSDQYVRSYNAVIARLQNKFAQPVRVGDGYNAFDEGAVMEELKEWLRDKWGVGKETAHEAVEGWKSKVKPFAPFQELLEKGSKEKPVEQSKAAESSSSSSDTSSSEEEVDGVAKKRKVEKLDEERAEGFIVVFNRIDRGKLHRSGKVGCWMAKARKFNRAMSYDSLPGPSEYTSRCKLCWPAVDDDGTSSDSEDELEDPASSGPTKGESSEQGLYSFLNKDSLWGE